MLRCNTISSPQPSRFRYETRRFSQSLLKANDMKIHEYQGKQIFRKYGVPTPRGIVAKTPEEAEKAAIELGTKVTVVKAQIHAGGRGKGGGVKLAKSPAEAKLLASQILGMMLKTPQTGPEGTKVQHPVHRGGPRHRQGATTSASRSIAPPRASPSWPPPRAAWRSRRWRTSTPRRSCASPSTRRSASGLPGPQAGLRPRPRGRLGGQVREVLLVALQGLRRDRRLAGRDQPAGAPEGRRRRRPRRQDELRRQRPVPPHGRGGHARHRRGGPARGRRPRSSTSPTSRSTATSAAW